MRREQSGLYLTAGSAPRAAGLRFPWGDMAVAAILAAGTCLLLRELFPSVTEPWWLLTLLMLPLCAALLLLYETKCGPWLLPSGALALLLLFLVGRTPVLSGFSCLGNDLLSLLTAHTGRIYLDFAAADADKLYWAVIPLLLLCALLLSRAVWSGRLWLALPLLLPAYAAMLTGLAPCGVSCGLLTAGTVLLMMQHTAKTGEDTTGLMHQSKDIDNRINSLLKGLEKIVSAIAEMRNNTSDAHGVGQKRYSIEAHHARLFVNSAATMADFILAVAMRKNSIE